MELEVLILFLDRVKVDIQLFRERSYKRGKAYSRMWKVIMGNGGFCGCLIEPQGVSTWWNETSQTRVFLLYYISK